MTRPLHIALVSLYALENNGIRHVAASLRGAGFPVTEIYFKDWRNNSFPWPLEHEIQALLHLLRERRVRFVGFSVRASAFHRIASTLTRRIRVELGIPVLWGGMHPTFLPEASIAEADYIALGEVDLTVADFFRAVEASRDPRRIPGYWARRGGEVHRNDLAPPPADLDALPFRDYHSAAWKFHIEGRRVTRGDPFIGNPEFTVLASRGCPYWTCTYCSNSVTRPLYHGLAPDWRVRSVEDVVAEVEAARRLNPRMRVVRFDDEVFPLGPERARAFRDLWPQRVGVPFEILVDPRMVREDELALLKAAGLRGLCMGVQATERVNRTFYGRNTTDQQIRDAQGTFARLGLKASLQVIWDDPESTEEDKDALFRLLLDLDRPFDLYLFGLTLYPGTHLARRLLREGRLHPHHVEGEGTHAFEQFRVDLDYPRPAADRRWLALLVLLNKPFVPKELVWRLYRVASFREDPAPLVRLAKATNLVQMATTVAGMAKRGEVSALLVRRWLNLDSVVTI